jgi:hypothetical protein
MSRRRLERPHQERRHLPPGHGLVGTVQVGLLATAGDPGIGDGLDRPLVDVAVVVEEGPARIQHRFFGDDPRAQGRHRQPGGEDDAEQEVHRCDQSGTGPAQEKP